ncbi:hypothetical protein R3P38DRAFT_2637112 [Favolaschia claudopus]|uniref:Alpha-type protein kinase domain-containing protein n=1 Tax=Favolaschia claudopus TaxID=2862362 RepID=A0AAW0ARJ7_9AGAR
MLPPPIPSQPNVAIPTSWPPSAYTYPPLLGNIQTPSVHPSGSAGTSFGYSQAHQQYAVQRQFWATKAYQSSVADTITLCFKILREVPGKPKGILVRNLTEGEPNVLASITPPGLRQLGIQRMETKLTAALRGLRVDWTRIPLREIVIWVDLAHQPPDIAYFHARCMTGKEPQPAPSFKKQTKAFELAFVIDSEYWEEIEQQLADDEVRSCSFSKISNRSSNGRRSSQHTLDGSTVDLESHARRPSPDQEDDFELDRASFNRNEDHSPVCAFSADLTRALKVSVTAPRTPPPSKRRIIYQSPNQDHLRDALLEGGSSYSQLWGQGPNSTSEQIQFFAINDCSLNDLLADRRFQGFVCDPANACMGSLVIEAGNYLGIGTFKTAEMGYLTLLHLTAGHLGPRANEPVAVKRMYKRRKTPTDANPGKWVLNRLTSADEHSKILMEANVLFWATSIMNFTYSFIYHFIQSSSERPPFEISEIRFVRAGVAIVHNQSTGPTTLKCSISRTYLIEERINEAKDGFYKFINNGSAVPLTMTRKDASELSEFLAFTQHVQFYKTKGAVYLSDLQGSMQLLTDPQIMTSPLIGEGAEIFGDGNVPSAFNSFPEQHCCKHICRWFELPELAASTDSDTRSVISNS